MTDKIKKLPMSERALTGQQELVEAIEAAIDQFSETHQLSNLMVIGALELAKLNYYIQYQDE